MKTPRFWYQKNGLAAHALVPAAGLYKAGGALRGFFARPYKAKIPLICVGNIVAGGSGKTPTALAVAELLKAEGQRPVFVTRGYGGCIKGPLRVDPHHHMARDVGDEALLLARAAPVYIGRDRIAAIKLAEKEATHVILDDGLQNPNILPDISLLVIDGASGLGNGRLIPAGPLRENLASALRRVKAVVMVGEDVTGLAARIEKPVIEAYLDARLPGDFPFGASFLAFAGIGRPEKFYESCRRAGLTLSSTRDFPDHHLFTQAELSSLQRRAQELGARLLTTEKDWVRLPPALQGKAMILPVVLVFARAGEIKSALSL